MTPQSVLEAIRRAVPAVGFGLCYICLFAIVLFS